MTDNVRWAVSLLRTALDVDDGVPGQATAELHELSERVNSGTINSADRTKLGVALWLVGVLFKEVESKEARTPPPAEGAP